MYIKREFVVNKITYFDNTLLIELVIIIKYLYSTFTMLRFNASYHFYYNKSS